MASCDHIRMIYMVVQEGETASMCSLLDEPDCSARDFIAIFMGLRQGCMVSAMWRYMTVFTMVDTVLSEIGL